MLNAAGREHSPPTNIADQHAPRELPTRSLDEQVPLEVQDHHIDQAVNQEVEHEKVQRGQHQHVGQSSRSHSQSSVMHTDNSNQHSCMFLQFFIDPKSISTFLLH